MVVCSRFPDKVKFKVESDLPRKSMLHLEYEIVSCQRADHWCIRSRFFWRLKEEFWGESSVYSLTSLAKILVVVVSRSKPSVMSFTYRLKRRGPTTLSWGTPLETWQEWESDEPTRTHCCLSVKKEDSQKRRLPPMPYPISLWRSLGWGTESKARWKSM